MNDSNSGSNQRRGVPRRGQRAGRQDNSSFGERRGRRYDGRRPNQGRTQQRGSDSSRSRHLPEPALPDDVVFADLDPEIRRELRSLDKANAENVGRHLLVAMDLIDDDPVKALEHGRAAKNRAARIGVVRETLGVIAYRAGEWNEALGELRAARRISGGPGLLALMADCERGLRRPERAIEIARGEQTAGMEEADIIELRIVEAGARVDMEQLDAALVTLADAGLDADAKGEGPARLAYAYADVLLAADRRDEAVEWFRVAARADTEDATGAAARVGELEN